MVSTKFNNLHIKITLLGVASTLLQSTSTKSNQN